MNSIREFVALGGSVYMCNNTLRLAIGDSPSDFLRIPILYAFAEEGSSEKEILDYYLNFLVDNYKKRSPQELAAEDAVKKAEIALKAAQDVLKQVKEK